MILSIDLPIVLAAAFVASSGPATLAIADTSMRSGRGVGLALALGVSTGSLVWSIAAALGLAVLMASSSWALATLRYAGGAYLLLLAFKSARGAVRGQAATSDVPVEASRSRAYAKRLALHLANPKPILFFGALYTLGVSPSTSPAELALVIVAVGLQSTLIFSAYAWLFSNPRVARGYVRARRWFDGTFALVFAGAGLKVLTSRLPA